MQETREAVLLCGGASAVGPGNYPQSFLWLVFIWGAVWQPVPAKRVYNCSTGLVSVLRTSDSHCEPLLRGD